MRIIIDTKSKTAQVYGYASQCEIEDFLKAIFPLGWRSIQVEQIFEDTSAGEGNVGWHGEVLPKNTVRDLTYFDKMWRP